MRVPIADPYGPSSGAGLIDCQTVAAPSGSRLRNILTVYPSEPRDRVKCIRESISTKKD